MYCVFCDSKDTLVIDSRPTESNSIKRKRRCNVCGGKFTTFERLELQDVTVIKRDGSREPFKFHKLYKSFNMALSKVPFTDTRRTDIFNAAQRIENSLLKDGLKNVDSIEIGRRVMEELKRIDKIAYLRFALVYKQFATLDDVASEIAALQEDTTSVHI